MAEIALKKAQAIRDTFQAGLFRADTAQRELKKLADETGMFDSISEEEIAANTGKTYQDVTALRDPLAGLGYGGEISAPFEGAAQDALTWDYSPSQPRDKKGRWTSGGGNSKIGKTKYAPSKRANKRGKTVSAKTFGILRGEFNTKYPGAKTGQQGQVSYKGKRYWLEADGSGSVIVKKSWKE